MKYYLCVLDFEATCWNEATDHGKDMRKQMEIIEFPSIMYLIDEESQTQTYIATFHEYVRPTINPLLSDFCTQLTGITQSQVDAADEFAAVYRRHIKWLGKHVPFEAGIPLVFVTCGKWDLEIQLPREIKNKGLRLNKYYTVSDTARQVDIKDAFFTVYGKKAAGLSGLLQSLNMTFEGRPHSGIDDSLNTAKCMIALIRAGWRVSP
jgi:inhibitor of KinA sporulation pathway (predicted exonuclease)